MISPLAFKVVMSPPTFFKIISLPLKEPVPVSRPALVVALSITPKASAAVRGLLAANSLSISLSRAINLPSGLRSPLDRDSSGEKGVGTEWHGL
jgi:hypothetical protein